uniref:Uncharacterized protein n=1 Tax=Rhizophora mucronata TaxID=61149 RepID=A0A2P2NS41_RHIMU
MVCTVISVSQPLFNQLLKGIGANASFC